ncbi:hypothetical protein MAPG_10519 [Magnaporthiopsis poae ATCC 64411]|uniref:Uncharacterized protein n=1 Tax=Magnaporthiopsis poae (strain ATCC 64411 / 73-15) TaxID=644358 RepID=A0A0C4ECT4_MAGP6|nr:hypothetical protein MAPG_10519 [Magnaporthiopsis poae ATCC 64411]
MGKPRRRSTLLGYEQNTGTPKHREGFAPGRKTWALKADDIIPKLSCHESFTVLDDDFQLTSLPRFSDVGQYQVTDAEQLELWAFETRRLVDIVNLGEPLELEGLEGWFGEADGDGYRRLNKLARQLIYATDICYLDNELIFLEYCPELSRLSNFLASKGRLLDNFGPGGAIHTAKGSIRLGEENDRSYQALVNYITGTLAQVLLRAMDGEFWDENVIVALAKLAAKLKIVGLDLTRSAAVCLAAAKGWEGRLRQTLKGDFPPPNKDSESSTDKQLAAVQRHIGHEGGRYFTLFASFHQCIGRSMLHVTQGLLSDPDTTAAADAFEASFIIYDTGFRQQRAMLCQERSGAICGSSYHSELHSADIAVEVFMRVLEKLRGEHGAAKPAPTPHTAVYWKWTKILPTEDGHSTSSDNSIKPTPPIHLGGSTARCVYLSSMKPVITALVPFLMLCGVFPSELSQMTYLARLVAPPGKPIMICEETRLLASFMVRTSSYSFTGDETVTTVCNSTTAQERALTKWPARRNTFSGSSDVEVMGDDNDGNDSIIIPYRWYCWGTLGFCTVLAAGGLAIGFTIEERIQGVDPFNISVFCWALAGFLVLFFKAIRVQEWPWRDFFLGRVVCKSVSEVVAVSWIKPQLLLAILLRLEPIMILNKRGPFEAVFTRRDAENGFAMTPPSGPRR